MSSRSDNPFELKDPEVQWCLDLFRARMSDWGTRKEAIERYMHQALAPKARYEPGLPLASISYKQDRIAWYLWLAEAYLYRRDEYEFFQGSRVIPFFKAIGRNRVHVERIDGLSERIARIADVETDAPDAGIFEILVGALYYRNEAEHVAFIAPNPPDKAPDLRVNIWRTAVFVECKRLAQSSGYSQNEREHWLKRWRKLSDWLAKNRVPVLLDIVFHQEVKDLPESILVDELPSRLLGVGADTVLLDDERCTVRVRPIDLERIQKHLEGHHVKYPSSFFIQLIAGEYRRHGGYTGLLEAKMGHFEGSRVLNQYLEDMKFAAGAFWSCDASLAIEAKARDIRKRLSEAAEQIPDGQPGVIHVGIESNDGWDVERQRVDRIFRTAIMFDPRGKLVEWVYVHFFEPESPPDEDWAIDETVTCFNRFGTSIRPLNERTLVVPEEVGGRDGFPWDTTP